MRERSLASFILRGVGSAAILAGAAYGGLVAYNRLKYGKVTPSSGMPSDSLLDRFLPDPEVVERHHILVDAPADVTMAAAKDFHLLDSPVVRAIIKMRELALGGTPDDRQHPAELLAQMQSIGWVVLAETAGREIVMGAVTQPWGAAPVFRSIPPAEFLNFSEPGYVKIAWTLRADPLEDRRSMFQTETRVSTTDADARKRFRKYWSFVAPGVELIRVAMLRPLKKAAEHAAHPVVAA